MKEILIRIQEKDSELVTQLLEKLGAEITEQPAKKSTGRKTKSEKKISPTFLFGKWKDLDLDAKTLREAAWERTQKFL